MACITNYSLKGILADCNPNLAGVIEAWIGYYGDYNVTIDVASGSTAPHSISSITANQGAKMEHYTFAKETGSLNSSITKDEANGTRFWTNQVTLVFSKLEGKKHLEVEALSVEQLVAIIHDSNGKYWYVGYDGYLSATESTAETGVAYTDRNGYSVTMAAQSAYLPFEMTKEQVDSVTE